MVTAGFQASKQLRIHPGWFIHISIVLLISSCGDNRQIKQQSITNLGDGFNLALSGATSSSGMTFDPSDGTIWIVNYFLSRVFHVYTSGKKLNDGFSYPTEYKVEAIALDTSDRTFWLPCTSKEYVYHFDSAGDQLNDGFSIAEVGATESMGIAYDSSDDSIWILDRTDDLFYHFDANTGTYLKDDVDLSQIGCTYGRAAAFDPRDNTYWLADQDSLKVYHIDKVGKVLEDSFDYSFLTTIGGAGGKSSGKPPVVEGIALDITDGTFWVMCLSRGWVFHLGY